jgi:glyoxylase-like metal-dependent hydrolase (beta-lactamase superfamily II)
VADASEIHPSFPLATPLADGAWLLDTRFDDRPGTIAVFLVPHAGASGRAGRFDLVEAGPAVSHDAVVRAVAATGHRVEDLDTVLVTHVHLDHAGGAGTLARRYGARIVAHARGAPHLADPKGLLASARRVYGDALDEMWGTMESVSKNRLLVVDDGDEIEVGGRPVRVLHTPGHASHHAAFLWPDGACYVGDAAGVRLPGSDVVRPALPPPETDLEAWDATLARLVEARPDRLRLTHFGEVDDPPAHLAEVGRKNRAWADAVLAWVAEGADESEIVARLDRLARAELERSGADEATVARHLGTSDAAMTASGLLRYWRTKRPERWQAAHRA